MEIKVVQKIDESYYHEFYAEWLKFRSVYKKWEDKIGMLSIALAIGIYILRQDLVYILGGLLVFGFLMIYEFYSSKRKWMKSRSESKINNVTITMIFQDNQIQSIGPFTEMKGKWSFFKEAIETENGIFLIPENGLSIYLQKKSFENQLDIKRIIEKVKDN